MSILNGVNIDFLVYSVVHPFVRYILLHVCWVTPPAGGPVLYLPTAQAGLATHKGKCNKMWQMRECATLYLQDTLCNMSAMTFQASRNIAYQNDNWHMCDRAMMMTAIWVGRGLRGGGATHSFTFSQRHPHSNPIPREEGGLYCKKFSVGMSCNEAGPRGQGAQPLCTLCFDPSVTMFCKPILTWANTAATVQAHW